MVAEQLAGMVGIIAVVGVLVGLIGAAARRLILTALGFGAAVSALFYQLILPLFAV